MNKRLAATHELHDFQLVTIAKAGLGPLLAADDGAVQFDRDPVGFHGQSLKQSREGQRRVEFARFAVDMKLHLQGLSQPKAFPDKSRNLGLDFSQLELAGGGATGVAGLHQDRRIRQRGFVDIDLHFGIAI